MIKSKSQLLFGSVAKSCPTLSVTPQTIVHQAPLSKGFTRQEYWSGLPFPSSGDLPHPGVKPAAPALAGGFFTTGDLRSPDRRCQQSLRKRHTQLQLLHHSLTATGKARSGCCCIHPSLRSAHTVLSRLPLVFFFLHQNMACRSRGR